MDTQFKKFLQIGILVNDLEGTIKNFESYGVGPWRRGEFDSNVFTEFEMNGEKKPLAMNMGFCNIYGFEIELIQPLCDCPYQDWLNEHGPGMHHLAIITRDSFDKVLEEHKIMTGRDPWMHCKEKNVGMDFAYLDLHKELGFFLELYNEEKTGGIDADFKLPEA